MNYALAIEKFNELKTGLKKELDEGQKKLDVSFSNEYYHRTRSIIDIFFTQPRNHNLRMRLRQVQTANKYFNNTTKIDTLIDFINSLVLELETLQENDLNHKRLTKYQGGEDAPPQELKKKPHVWEPEQLDIITDAVLEYFEWGVVISITDLLSNELYEEYVPFLEKNKYGKVQAWELIDYMREAGLIEKDNKDTERITKFGLDVKRKGGYLKYYSKKLDNLIEQTSKTIEVNELVNKPELVKPVQPVRLPEVVKPVETGIWQKHKDKVSEGYYEGIKEGTKKTTSTIILWVVGLGLGLPSLGFAIWRIIKAYIEYTKK